MSESPEQKSWQALFEEVIEGRLDSAASDQVDQGVRDDPEFRRAYTEYMHQHASLRWHSAGAAGMRRDRTTAPAVVYRMGPWVAAACAAMVCLAGLGLWWQAADEAPIAELTQTQGCRWGAGDLPTRSGSPLRRGTLRLIEGVASLRFSSGTTLELEGPATLEILDPKRCILQEGVAVAHVPPSAVGFVIDTPSARLIDYGTSFGVSVGAEGHADVEVFDGRVDVHHNASGQQRKLLEGDRVSVKSDGIAEKTAPGFEPRRLPDPAPVSAAAEHTITTAMGRGKDAFVEYSPKSPGKDYPSDTVLMVKHNPDEIYSRKAYLGFDLRSLAGRSVHAARLILTLEPSGRGFNGNLPEAEFEVFGLTESSRDDWDPAMDWDQAPANITAGDALDARRVISLGRFTVPVGARQGVCTIQGRELVDFLNAKQNGYATLVVMRRTPATRSGSLVHGFASRRHPTAAPPTLKLILAAP